MEHHICDICKKSVPLDMLLYNHDVSKYVCKICTEHMESENLIERIEFLEELLQHDTEGDAEYAVDVLLKLLKSLAVKVMIYQQKENNSY